MTECKNCYYRFRNIFFRKNCPHCRRPLKGGGGFDRRAEPHATIPGSLPRKEDGTLERQSIVHEYPRRDSNDGFVPGYVMGSLLDDDRKPDPYAAAAEKLYGDKIPSDDSTKTETQHVVPDAVYESTSSYDSGSSSSGGDGGGGGGGD